MKKIRSIAVILVMALLAAALSGCGIVKIIPAGTEAEYTGEVAFDAGAEAAGDWAVITEEVAAAATDLAGAEIGSEAVAVSFTATVAEYNTDSPKAYLVVTVDGVSAEVQIPSGDKYSSTNTSIRDCQTLKEFGSFTNQTEWSEYAKTLNSESYANVITPLGDLDALVGTTVEVIGCAVADGDTYVVSPVSITAQ